MPQIAEARRRVGESGTLGDQSRGIALRDPGEFSVCDEEILIRLRPGFAAHHLDGVNATFEIDHAEPYSKKGWSVEVEGPARLLTYEEVARLGGNVPEPLVMYPGMRVFSIRVERISGRSIRHNHVETSPPSSTYWPDRYREGETSSDENVDHGRNPSG